MAAFPPSEDWLRYVLPRPDSAYFTLLPQTRLDFACLSLYDKAARVAVLGLVQYARLSLLAQSALRQMRGPRGRSKMRLCYEHRSLLLYQISVFQDCFYADYTFLKTIQSTAIRSLFQLSASLQDVKSDARCCSVCVMDHLYCSNGYLSR